MKISREQAYQILGVPEGANLEDIRSSYKHLARKWHPDKQDGKIPSEEATKKFQEVSAAYKKLTSNERDNDEDGMTLAEMMELYRQFFSFGNSAMGQCNCRNHPPYYRYNDEVSDYDDYDYTEEEDSDDEFWESITSRLRTKYEARKYMHKGDATDISSSKITEEEALRNAQELIEEEEIEKKRKEKKKAKKKKKKEKRKQKDKNQKTDIENVDKKEKGEKVEEKEEKAELPMSNGHVGKSSSKSAPTKSNNKKVEKGLADTFSKPIKGMIVQEDIRPCIANDNKTNKPKRDRQDAQSMANGNDSSDGGEQFDASSAFFARAASKAPSVQLTPQHSSSSKDQENNRKDQPRKNSVQKNKESKKPANTSKERKETNKNISTSENNESNALKNMQENGINTKQQEVNACMIDDIVIKSRQLAVKGNDLASKEQYTEAIKMFSEAIILDPTDFRFFGNRSYCYDRTGQYENALKDAESAIRLAEHWPKGYFRKGRAFTGLQRYQEAEAAFQTVLKLDADCPDAQFELAKVRVRILTDMGFDIQLADESIRKHGTVQFALEALLAGNVTPRSDTDETFGNLAEAYEDTNVSNSTSRSEKQTIIVTTPNKTKPQQSCTALWIGNVCAHSVSEKQLTQLFSKCGKLASVRILAEKYCAFINYQNPEGASRALEKLQGVQIGGQNLLIRYPNNPPPGSNVHPDKNTSQQPNGRKSAEKNGLSKVTGPVNGNECYFWRTTGCVFENHCRYKHAEETKGVDLAKVHAKYGNLFIKD